MGRPVSFDFASGGGSTAEFLMGEVEIEPTLMHNVGTRIVLPDTVTLPLINGKAIHPDMAISPDGPEPAWAYKITVRSGMTGRAWSEFRGVPAGTEQVAYKDLPKYQTGPNPPGLAPSVDFLVKESITDDSTVMQAVSASLDIAITGMDLVTWVDGNKQEDIVGGHLDKEKHATWLTHDESGGPTKYARERLGIEKIEGSNQAVGGHLDKEKHATWLTHDESGGMTSYAVDRVLEALGVNAGRVREALGIEGGVSPVPLASRHPVLENDLRIDNGGTIRTEGAAPVCLIFDHGLDNFRDIVLPLLTARGLSSVMAINGNLHKPGYNIESESSNVTWAEIDGWTSVEIANHGAAHSNSSYPVEQMEAEIVGSLTDLKANLPSKQIRTWVQPAADYPEDFNNGDSVHSYADTATGKLILEHHAVATGMWRTPTHPLIPRDGTILQGMTGYWIDNTGSTTAAKNHITVAAAQGKGILIRNHPRVIDVDGTRLSTTELTSFLDFLKAEQDAGHIKVMTLSQWAIADTGI